MAMIQKNYFLKDPKKPNSSSFEVLRGTCQKIYCDLSGEKPS
jgi:hypothetical protein